MDSSFGIDKLEGSKLCALTPEIRQQLEQAWRTTEELFFRLVHADTRGAENQTLGLRYADAVREELSSKIPADVLFFMGMYVMNCAARDILFAEKQVADRGGKDN